MRVVHLGEQRVQGAVFVKRPTTASHSAVDCATDRDDVVHVATDDLTGAAHIRDLLVAEIDQAKTKVLFCSFLFADEKIVAALCRAAERLHGGVYVLTALGKHLQAEVLELDSDIAPSVTKEQERARRHADHLQRLALAGAWLRSSEDCHAKFCVIDDAAVLVTSANATQEAYEANPEDGLFVRDSAVARELGRLFAHVWIELAGLESPPGAGLNVRSLAQRAPPPWAHLQGNGGPLTPVATLRGSEASLLGAATGVIDAARHTLAIATYSFCDLEDHAIGVSLARAVERKVEIDLLVQPRNHVVAQRRTCAWLLGLDPRRVRIHGHRRTHTKSIVADDRAVLTWTGNLEAAHGWRDGIEVGLSGHDAGIAAAVARFTRGVMGRGTHAVLIAPTVKELVQHGEVGQMRGDWVMHATPDMKLDEIARLLSDNPVELVDTAEGVALRCAEEALISLSEPPGSNVLRAREIHRPSGKIRARSRGWVVDCTMGIVGTEASGHRDARQPDRASARRRHR